MTYDVSLLTLRPGTTPRALPKLESGLKTLSGVLACWYSEIGSLNRILILREHDASEAGARVRQELARERDLFGIGEFLTSASHDVFMSFDFMEGIKPAVTGGLFEVRTYTLKPDGLRPTLELWRKAVPARAALSPLLAAMHSLTGATPRFMHIWPYTDLAERQRIRGEAGRTGIWPPSGGPDHIAVMNSDIYLPAPFSPLR